MSDEQAHAETIVALLTAALAPRAEALELDEVDRRADAGNLPAEYVEVTIARRFGGEDRLGVWQGTEAWRVTTRVVAPRIKNARVMRKKVRAALEYAALAISGDTTTPVRFETEDEISADKERTFSGFSIWTYVL